MKVSGFYDLNVPIDAIDGKSLTKICERLFNYGYRTVAFNQVVTLSDDMFQKPKKKRKLMDSNGSDDNLREADPIPPPAQIHLPEHLQGKLHVFNRLTLCVGEMSVLDRINKNGNIRKYHLLAFSPVNEESLEAIASLPMDFDLLEVDVGCPSLSKSFSFKVKNKTVEKNLFLEVKYSPAISDTEFLKNTLNLTHSINKLRCTKNVIFTSGAVSLSHIRGPYDVMNLGVLFGFVEGTVKAAITTSCRNLLLKAEERGYGRIPVLLKPVTPKQWVNNYSNETEPKEKRSKDESMEFQ